MQRHELSRSPVLNRKQAQQQAERREQERQQEREQQREPQARQVAALQAQYGNRLTSAALQESGQEVSGPAALVHTQLALGVAGLALGEGPFGAMGNREAGLALAGLAEAGAGVGDPFGVGNDISIGDISGSDIAASDMGGDVLSRHAGHGGGGGAAARVARAQQSSGSPLPSAVRAEAEARLGAGSLASVRVHTDGAAQAAAEAVEARAFTVGTHIWFGPGQFAPSSGSGRELLLHELTHVMQNMRGDPQGAPSAVIDGVAVSSPGDRREQEAEQVAARASRGPAPQAEQPEQAVEQERSAEQAVEQGRSAEQAAEQGRSAEQSPMMAGAVLERDKQSDIRAGMDATFNAFTNIPVQVPVKLGKDTWNTLVVIQAHYRINQNNDAGERQFSKVRSERPDSTVTDPETQEKKVNKSLKEAEASAGQGKATPTEYRQVIQAAIDQGLITGIPVILEKTDATGQTLTEAGRAKVEEKARAGIGKYAQYSYGVDCSGFVYQAVAQIRRGQKLDEDWAGGKMNTGSQTPKESNVGTKITSASEYQSGDLMITPGHIRMIYQRGTVSGDDAAAIRKKLDLPEGAQLHTVLTYESSPSQPQAGHQGYYGRDAKGADKPADMKRWGLNKQPFLVVQTTTAGNPKKKIKPKTTVQWYKQTEDGNYEPANSVAVQRVQTGADQQTNGAAIQRDALGPASAGATFDPGSLAGGAALPAELMERMESMFGEDFSNVRLHTGGEAAGMAAEVNARAFTHGSDIVFGAGRFNPGSPEGERLIAHELTHVVQTGGRAAGVARDGLEIAAPTSQSEVEAERVAAAVVSGQDIGHIGAMAVADIHRDAGPNDILFQLETAGASKATASQDKLKSGGVGASETMAADDKARVLAYKESLTKVAQEFNFPPALLAGIASRESRGGDQLDGEGWSRHDGMAFGIMQVDKRYFTPVGSDQGKAGAGSEGHIRQVAGIIDGFRKQMKKKFPDASEAEILRATVAAYNTGPSRVKSVDTPDRATTGKDYSSDVWARARAYAPDFGGAPEQQDQGAAIQRDGLGPVAAGATFDPGSLSGGAPLPEATRAQMESSFGADFSNVRIHADSEAAGAAAAVNAKAFAFGSDIVFGGGRFAPGTTEGDHLIAHELTHVVQQQGRAASTARKGLDVSSGSESSEIEADRVADAVVSGGAVGVDTGAISTAPSTISREGERNWWDLTGRARDAAIGRARQTLLRYWPEGAGLIVSGRLGATFGVPIALDLGGKEELFRVVAENFRITRVGQMRVGVDTSAGAGGGFNIGPVRAEVRASASAGAGVRMTASEVYEFPTGTDEGLLGFMQRVVPLEMTSMGQLASLFLQTISGVDPARYRRRFTVELAGYGEANAGASGGVRFGGQGADANTTQQQAQQAATQQQPWWARLLPNALATAGVRLEAGLGLEVSPGATPQAQTTGRVYMLAGATAAAGASVSLSGGDGVRGKLLSIIRQRFQVVDVDMQAQLGLTFAMDPNGQINWTGYEAKLRSHPPDETGVVDSVGTDVTASYNRTQDNTGGQGSQGGGVSEWINRLIPDGLEIEKRLGLGTGFGQRWIALNGPLMRNELRLAGNYQNRGFSVDGVMTLKFKLDRAKLQRVAAWMQGLVTGSGDAQGQARQAWQGFIRWLQTGEAPSWAQNPAQIAGFLQDAGLDTARVRFTASFGVGAGGSVGAGLKARLDGGITVAGFKEIDLRPQAATLIQSCVADVSAFLSTLGGNTQAQVAPAGQTPLAPAGAIQRDGIGPAPASHGFTPDMASGGSRMPAEVQSRMESSFGSDFSGVRLHTDGAAAGLSSGLNARAFTYGSHIFFGAGQYSPGSQSGDQLLAHELTHTEQQSGGAGSVALKGNGAGVPVVDGNSTDERAAEDKGQQTAQQLALLKVIKTKSNAELRRMLYGADGKKIDIDGYTGIQKEILDAAESELETRLEPKADLGTSKMSNERNLGKGAYTHTPHTDAITDSRTSKKGNTVFTYKDKDGNTTESRGYTGADAKKQFSRDAGEGKIQTGTGWQKDQGDKTMTVQGYRTTEKGKQVVVYQAPDGSIKEKIGKKDESRDDLLRRFTEEQKKKGGGEVKKPSAWQGHQTTVTTADKELFKKEADASAYKSEGTTQNAGGTLDHSVAVGEVKAGVTGKYKSGPDGKSLEVEASASAKLVDFNFTQSWESGVMDLFGEQVSGRIYLVLRGMVGVEAKAKIEANAKLMKGKKQPDLKQLTAGTDMQVKPGGDVSMGQRVKNAASERVEASAGAHAEAFAGAKLQIAAGFSVDWHQKQAEVYKQRVANAVNGLVGLIHPGLAWLFKKLGGDAVVGKLNGLLGWKEGIVSLLGIEVGAAGSLGVGAHLDASVGFKGGKFRFQWSMGLTWGLGLGTSLNVAIDAKEGVKFALAMATSTDLQQLVTAWFKENAKKVVDGVGGAFQALSDWFGADDKIREMVANRYHEVAPPEERGRMIQTLVGGYCGDDDEDAVVRILQFSKQKGDLARVLASGASKDDILWALDGEQDDQARAILG